MKKKLYYVVTKETMCLDGNIGLEETTGLKDIVVYEILDNEPIKFFHLDSVANSENSQEAIQDYLSDNGYGDDTFEFIEL